MGRIAGPFPTPPFPTFRVSPIAVIPKKSSSEFRLIHNLAFPLNESVNDFIDKDQCTVKYASIDDAVKIIQNLGKNTLLAKCDIKSAFRLLRLSPTEFDLTGFKFENEYYFDKCLPMGASIIYAYLKPFLLYFIGMFKRNQRIKIFCTTWMIFLLAGKQEQCSAVIYFQFFNIHAKKGGWSLSLMKKQLSLQKSWCFSVYNLIPLIWLCGSHRKNFRI